MLDPAARVRRLRPKLLGAAPPPRLHQPATNARHPRVVAVREHQLDVLDVGMGLRGVRTAATVAADQDHDQGDVAQARRAVGLVSLTRVEAVGEHPRSALGVDGDELRQVVVLAPQVRPRVDGDDLGPRRGVEAPEPVLAGGREAEVAELEPPVGARAAVLGRVGAARLRDRLGCGAAVGVALEHRVGGVCCQGGRGARRGRRHRGERDRGQQRRPSHGPNSCATAEPPPPLLGDGAGAAGAGSARPARSRRRRTRAPPAASSAPAAARARERALARVRSAARGVGAGLRLGDAGGERPRHLRRAPPRPAPGATVTWAGRSRRGSIPRSALGPAAEPERSDAGGHAGGRRDAAAEAGDRQLSGRAKAGELRQHTGTGRAGTARAAGRRLRRPARPPPVARARRRPADAVAELEQAVRVVDLAVDPVDRSGGRGRGAEVVQVAAEPGDEVRALAAVGQVRAGLALLVGRREAADQGAQQRLSVRAPLAPLERPHPLGQLGDAAGDLLAVGARREALDQRAHLAGLQPPAVAQQHHCPPPRRQRGQQVASHPRLLGAARQLIGGSAGSATPPTSSSGAVGLRRRRRSSLPAWLATAVST